MVSVAVVFVIVLAVASLFSVELHRRRAAERSLHRALASVEQQVADRTAKLELALDELRRSEHRLEGALRVAEEANQLKDEFLATASHELRTPLNAIVGWVRVLQTRALASEEQREQALNAIERNARIQTRLVEDLLDVSRMIQGRVSLSVAPIDLRSVVASAVETVGHAAVAKQIAIDCDEPAEPVPVIGDEHRLQQVIWNLLANSVKFTPRGGRVSVSLRTAGAQVVVKVADTGEGIEPAFLPHVFEPFRQGVTGAARTGLGLGLAIVRRLVDLHGGRIGAESAGPGRGAVFTVSLPVAQSAAAASPDAAVVPEPLRVAVGADYIRPAAAVRAMPDLHGAESSRRRPSAPGVTTE